MLAFRHTWLLRESLMTLLLLVLLCYGFTKSWIRLASLSQPDDKGECPAKLPGCPQRASWRARMKKREPGRSVRF